MGLKNSLTENLGAKIIAVFVVLFIWFNASGQKEVIWLKMVPITLNNIPDSLVVTGHAQQQAEIKHGLFQLITGSGQIGHIAACCEVLAARVLAQFLQLACTE